MTASQRLSESQRKTNKVNPAAYKLLKTGEPPLAVGSRGSRERDGCFLAALVGVRHSVIGVRFDGASARLSTALFGDPQRSRRLLIPLA